MLNNIVLTDYDIMENSSGDLLITYFSSFRIDESFHNPLKVEKLILKSGNDICVRRSESYKLNFLNFPRKFLDRVLQKGFLLSEVAIEDNSIKTVKVNP